VLAGCGKPVTVAIDPPAATLQPGDSMRFTATVTGARNTDVNWTITEQGSGELHQGLYNAPKRAGIFHISAASVAQPNRNAVATVTIMPMPVVLDPIMVMLPLSKAKSSSPVVFTAVAIDESGEHPAAVTWSVREKDGGTITHAGEYTPPLKAGEYHVVATSKDDPEVTAIAGINILK